MKIFNENYNFEDNFVEEINNNNFNKFQWQRFSKYSFCKKFLEKYNMKIKNSMETFNPDYIEVDDGTLKGRVMTFEQIKNIIEKNKEKKANKQQKKENEK